MRFITSVLGMQRLAKRWRREGVEVGFVPTMGCLHEGHMSLVERARKLVGPKGRIVVSIYVNPAQFGPAEDFSKYPRELPRDTALCRAAKVDLLFAPKDHEIYPAPPDGTFGTYVVEETLSQGMEGASRPTHFRGVATIVAKLFNIVLPDTAVFGAKDFQQAAVVQGMVHDLNFPIRIVVAPTLREADGLAMSSRNRYLSPEERRQATVLWRGIQLARATTRGSQSGVSASKMRDQLVKFISDHPAARVDYIAFFDPATLQPVNFLKPGTHMAMAIFIGRTRLIDNAKL